jgi:hypothetical protein
MNVTRVTVERLKNLGNYENEKVGLTATLEDGEDCLEAAEELKVLVMKSLGVPASSSAREDLLAHHPRQHGS